MMKNLYMGYPEVQGYPIHANMTSILSKHPSYENWLLTNYTQLRLDYYENDLINPYFLDFYQPLMREYHPLLNIHSIRKQMLRNLNVNIIDFLINCLEQDNYVYILIDKQYISAYKTKQSLPHDLFIFGYNKTNKTFAIADYFPDTFPIYSHQLATFDEIEKAININSDYANDSWDNIFGIQMIQSNHWKTCEFDINYFIQSIKDFINSKITSENYEFIEGIPKKIPEIHGSNKSVFGKKIYKELYQLANFNYLFLRAVHILFEHKVLMNKRINFLIKNRIIDKEYSNNSLKIKSKTEILRNFIIKNMIKNKGEEINKLKEMIEEIEALEFGFLKSLLIKLQ